MIIKSFELGKIDLKKNNFFLLYGVNEGLKKITIEEKFKKFYSNNTYDYEESEILKKKEEFFNNILTKSFFEKEKLIIITRATDKIKDTVEEILDKNIEDLVVVLNAQILEKKSKIRSLFEKDSNLAAVACYKDNERTLIEYILEQLRAHKGLTRENIDIIISNSNLDRRVIKNELIKIKEFFKNKTITREELQQLLNIKINLNFDQLRDAALLGERSTINKLIGETEFLPEDIFFYLSSINYRVIKLIEVKNNNGDDNISIDAMKPKIFWKDKPIYIQQLKKWDIDKLKAASIKIAEVEKLMKKNAIIRNDLVIKDLLIHLCKQISTSSI